MRLLYAIYDKKAETYGPVVSAAHDAVATRDFASSCADERTALHQYPQDFELHRLGTFHDVASPIAEAGELVVHAKPVLIVTAEAVRAMTKPEDKASGVTVRDY